MNQSQTKICQNCKNQFVIEPEDFAFYEKIKVPPPTFCPHCRLQRRLAYKNERTLYKRTCDLCKKSIIAMFPQDAPFSVYCPSCWFSDKWDALEYGLEYNTNQHFFRQFSALREKVPRPSLYIDYPRTVGSTYMNLTGPIKNCYLVFLAEDDENCAYSSSLFHSKDSFDCANASKIILSYELVNCDNCYQSFFSFDCKNCLNVYFSKNLINCSDCFGCVNLRNKKFHIFNQPHTQEQYNNTFKKLWNGSYRNLEIQRQKLEELRDRFPQKYIHGFSNVNSSGDYLYECKNVRYSFQVTGGVDSKYLYMVNMKPVANNYDYSDWGNNASWMYDCVNCGENIARASFSYGCWGGSNMDYCDFSVFSHYMFGCVSTMKKEYCILNKQYSKEEFEVLRDKIIADMNQTLYVDKRGRIYKYGEFFPMELSLYPYMDTAAFDSFPLNEEEIKSQNYRWRPEEKKDYIPTIKAENLPDNIAEIDKEKILSEVITCAHEGKCRDKCTYAFKFIPQEIDFYKRHKLPLPRLCHNCRHYRRFRQLTPLRLWPRSCGCAGKTSDNGLYNNTAVHPHQNNHCFNEFDTAYSPDRKEIVYCEKCYQEEVA